MDALSKSLRLPREKHFEPQKVVRDPGVLSSILGGIFEGSIRKSSKKASFWSFEALLLKGFKAFESQINWTNLRPWNLKPNESNLNFKDMESQINYPCESQVSGLGRGCNSQFEVKLLTDQGQLQLMPNFSLFKSRLGAKFGSCSAFWLRCSLFSFPLYLISVGTISSFFRPTTTLDFVWNLGRKSFVFQDPSRQQ